MPIITRSVEHPGSAIANFYQPVAVRPAIVPVFRSYATSSEPDLKATFLEVLPAKRELLKKVKAHGGKVIGDVKIENTLGGMRYDSTTFLESWLTIAQRIESNGMGRLSP
jgi:hypothetical protein